MNPDLPDDETTRRLARAMHDEVDRVEVSSDSLARIQARAAGSAARTARWWLAPLAAAAVVGLVAAGAVLIPRGTDHVATPPGSGTTTAGATRVVSPTPDESAPSPQVSTGISSPPPSSAGPGPSASSSGHASGDGTADPLGCVSQGRTGYAYYVSDLNGQGPRLYRAMLPLSCHLGVEEALTVPAGKDPDFDSLWPSGTKVLSVTVHGSTATVDLSAFPDTDATTETAAVQQLVWTVTANRPALSAVRVLVNGAPPQGHEDWSKPVRRAAALGTVANVWILTPGSGAAIGSPVTVRVYGTGYEGQVPIKVFQGDQEVASTAVTTMMGSFAEASTTIDLPPGTYELRAYNDNAADGSLTLWDTKVFTVT